MQAVRQGLIVELEDLIQECQERVNMRDKYGLRPIHYATRYNQAATVELLLTYKAGMILELAMVLVYCDW
jgi:ankyrin repeat protein